MAHCGERRRSGAGLDGAAVQETHDEPGTGRLSAAVGRRGARATPGGRTGATRGKAAVAAPTGAREAPGGLSEGEPAGDDVATARVAIDGLWMFHRRVAGPAGLPVVLVHGLGLSGRYMLPTARHLAPSFAVYLPDLPGFGDSARPERALDVPGLAEALAAWLRAVELAPAALLGNSFGCQIIADLAARRPELVAGIVLQGPTTPPDERSWLWQFVRWRQNQPFNPDDLGPITWGDYRKCGYLRLLQTFRHQIRDPIERKLPLIRAPTLVVRGQHDPICRLPFAKEVTRRLPRGRLVEIPEVAHTLVYTAPEQLAQVTRQFLEEAGREMPQEAAPGSRMRGSAGRSDVR
jgi:2-hydroxy-6-oxonona-2,4-dienedioate hydrolase